MPLDEKWMEAVDVWERQNTFCGRRRSAEERTEPGPMVVTQGPRSMTATHGLGVFNFYKASIPERIPSRKSPDLHERSLHSSLSARLPALAYDFPQHNAWL